MVDCAVDGVPFYAVLKLNYRPGFTHVTNVMGNGRCSTIAPQRTLLPGNSKADEAALIDRANLTIRLIEKKVALDDKKDFYLSTKVFACTQAMPEKAKLKAVCETAVGHCILSVLRQCHVQEHVLQGLYQAEHLPGRSCLSSIRIPGT